MKSEGLYSLTFTLRQAEHCNQGGLFTDKSQRTFASKTVFARQYTAGTLSSTLIWQWFIYILKRYIAVGEANGKSSTFTIKQSVTHRLCGLPVVLSDSPQKFLGVRHAFLHPLTPSIAPARSELLHFCTINLLFVPPDSFLVLCRDFFATFLILWKGFFQRILTDFLKVLVKTFDYKLFSTGFETGLIEFGKRT